MKFPSSRPAALCGVAALSLSSLPSLAPAQEVYALASETPAQPVVVTATRFPEDADRLPFGVSVITAEELRRSGASTVNEALMRLLGLPGRLDLYGGGEYSLDLRGFGITADNNQVVVVDGLRLSEGDTSGTRLADIPIETVERIEVLRGNAAVLYGEGATGGAIVVTTRAGAQRTGGQVRATAGSRGLRELRGNVTAAWDQFSLNAAAQRREADNFRDNARTEGQAGSLAGQWRQGSTRLGARLSADKLDARLPGELTAEQYAANPWQTLKPNDWGRIRNQRHGLFAETQLGGWSLGLDAGWRQKQLRSVSTFFGTASPYDYDVDADSQSLRARTELALGGLRHALVLGVERNAWTRDVFGALASHATQRSVGVYAKDDVEFGRDTRLSAGVRSEKIDKRLTSAAAPQTLEDRLPAWDLGLTQGLGGGWTAYGRVGRSFRLANADEYGFTNPAVPLRPQVSRDIELGTRWTHARGRVETRLYRSALRDEIGLDPASYRNVNFDRTRRQGVEIEARQALGKAVDLRVNAAWRRAEFTSGPNSGNALALVPKAALALNLDWTPLAQHRVNVGTQWVSMSHPDFAGQCRIPGYATLHARYAYQWNDVELALAATNLTDRRFYTQAFDCANGVTGSIYPEPGRAVTASVAVRF